MRIKQQLTEVVSLIKRTGSKKNVKRAAQAVPWNDSRTLFRIVQNLTGTYTSKSMSIKSKTG